MYFIHQIVYNFSRNFFLFHTFPLFPVTPSSFLPLHYPPSLFQSEFSVVTLSDVTPNEPFFYEVYYPSHSVFRDFTVVRTLQLLTVRLHSSLSSPQPPVFESLYYPSVSHTSKHQGILLKSKVTVTPLLLSVMITSEHLVPLVGCSRDVNLVE